MTSLRLIVCSLKHHWRTHLGVVLGAAIGTTVLAGALLVGDSVRASLQQLAKARLGQVTAALIGNDRFFNAKLAKAVATTSGAPMAAFLQLPGTVASGEGSARANRVQVMGVSPDFWLLGPTESAGGQHRVFEEIPTGTVWLNEPLAEHLNARVGDSVVLRVPKPSLLSRDAPLSPTEDTAVALRLKIDRILSASEFGRFSFQASQLPSLNAFVSLTDLQEKLGIIHQANGMISGLREAEGVSSQSLTHQSRTITRLDEAFRAHATLADLGVQLLPLTNGQSEVRTPRVFLDPPVIAAAQATKLEVMPILTYFSNELRVRSRSTPYSMVTALPPSQNLGVSTGPSLRTLLPDRFQDDEIIINQWLAEDLQAAPGDELEMAYYVVGTARQLVEHRRKFRVHSIVPMEGPAGDRTLMPDFPGMSNAENCRDWDTGFPIKTDAIREKDETYWKTYRGTPKAFVSLAAGQSMWTNRFGDLTALRFNAASAEVETKLRQRLDPATVGLSFTDVRAQAIAASSQGQDFGQLFLGFSFFLIVSALMLMTLLFRFSLEQRSSEMGILLALGFAPRQVRALLLSEGALLSLLGGAIGMVGGMGYARAMLYGLSTLWRSAVGTSMLIYDARLATLLIGALSSVVLAILTVFLSVRREAKRPARALLQETSGSEFESTTLAHGKGRGAFWLGVGLFLPAVGLTCYGLFDRKVATPEMFFGAATLLLSAGIAFVTWLLRRAAVPIAASDLTLMRLGLQNVTRRMGRSRAIIILLASGSFLIASIGIFRLDATTGQHLRASGTGGFAFVGESALPVIQDLNTSAGRDFYNLDAKLLTNATFVPLRLREGDDASCLNLNRAQKPRLLGLNPDDLAQRKAFTFAGVETQSAQQPWLLLNQKLANDEIPAIADANSIQWALGKKLGDTLPYTDEQGRVRRIRLVGAVANSILQGSLIISEENFVSLFPSESGYRFFLVDASPTIGSTTLSDLSKHLTRSLQDHGLELAPSVNRLNALNAVQNTYLNTFQILGGLGLLLGSLGLGLVVLRNVLERRTELGLLQALGVNRKRVLMLVLGEHGLLLTIGLVLGTFAACVAVLPAALTPGAPLPLGSLVLTLIGVGLFGGLATCTAALYALRGRLIDALRGE